MWAQGFFFLFFFFFSLFDFLTCRASFVFCVCMCAQEHFGALFAQLPPNLRRAAPFALPASYAADADEGDDAADSEEESEAADEAKQQGLAACADFVFKLFPDAKVVVDTRRQG